MSNEVRLIPHSMILLLQNPRNASTRLIYESFVKWVIHALILLNVFSTHTLTDRP